MACDVWGLRGSMSLWLTVSGRQGGRERVSVARDVWRAWSTWQTDESAKRNGPLHGNHHCNTVFAPFLKMEQ